MTDNERGILLLIKSSVTGEAAPMPEGFSIYKNAKRIYQLGLLPMCYNGMVNCGLLEENTELNNKLADMYCLDVVSSDRQLFRLDEMFARFEAEGIEYMPVKGAVMKQLYPVPEMRPMGDADILIHTKDRDKLAVLMAELGYRPLSESDHEWNWISHDMKVELHKRLVSSDDKMYYSYFGDGWQFAKDQQGCRWSMSPEDMFVFDFTHFTKHYCKSGVNVRHVADLWLHTCKNPQLDLVYIRNQLAKMQLEVFFDHVMALIDAWFCDGQWNDRLIHITDYIFSGGVTKAVSEQARVAQHAGKKKSGKMGVILTRLFPGRKHLDWNYPKLKKVPLPFAWVARWFMLMTSRKDSVKKRSQEMRNTSGQSVIEHNERLEYVGLQFPE